jgi:hypothetical protein
MRKILFPFISVWSSAAGVPPLAAVVESVHRDAYLQALVGGGAGHLTAFYLHQENVQC